ncbi:zinc finger protein ZAT9-like [Magnolia sinica]|uniref:zinc finger protein ZAT9-like n=1 Tax=Magnolia sinica TaxID=86752 RepID=UPI002659DA3E|nr:zinc finger protein ZAT9-like [Magnolia sinica]
MEKRTCKLCSKTFSNGRALGGHMRSHMTILSPSPPPKPQSQPSPSSSSSSSSSEEEGNEAEEAKALSYGLRENPQKSFRIVDPEFSFAFDAGSVVQDRESETESSKHPSRWRSKRTRRQAESKPELELEPVSSVSDTTTEEDVALCLMMLSRDIWMKDSIKALPESEEEEEDEEEDEDEDEEDYSAPELKFYPKGRSKYQCGTCKKVFRSYQALGGHRASHKKIKAFTTAATPPATSAMRIQERESATVSAGRADDRRVHQCPVCFRVFGSGQALGGHKRSHLSASTSAAATAATKFNDNMIDLNLPAPVEDDDISQVELSAVSDAEFVDPAK